MNIKEFSEKYSVDKRSIDYWTNLGFLHPGKSEKGSNSRKYRDYTPCEKEIMKILVLKNAGIDNAEIEPWLKMFDSNESSAAKKCFKTFLKSSLETELKKIEAQYKSCIDYVDKL